MKPLAGIRVIEMGTVVLAPYAATLLADMGATVIKLEQLGGDSTRSLGHSEHAGLAATFLNCNRGKQSIALDLRKPEALAALKRLIGQSDVFLHNMRMDSAERLGVGYESLKAANPRLVYCATYGYGAAGCYATRPAYDDIIQAACGLAALKGAVDGTPAYAPTIIADKTTALFVVIGIMGALMERSRTGQGRQLSASPSHEGWLSRRDAPQREPMAKIFHCRWQARRSDRPAFCHRRATLEQHPGALPDRKRSAARTDLGGVDGTVHRTRRAIRACQHHRGSGGGCTSG